MFEFCERVHFKLLEARYVGPEGEELISLAEVRSRFGQEVNRILLEDNFAYSFADGTFGRSGSRHYQSTSSAAQKVLVRPELSDARGHYSKALRFFEGGPNADYPNSVKEAIAALEAAAKVFFPEANEKDLARLLKKVSGTSETEVPPTIAKAIENLYNFRGAASQVAHGGARGGG